MRSVSQLKIKRGYDISRTHLEPSVPFHVKSFAMYCQETDKSRTLYLDKIARGRDLDRPLPRTDELLGLILPRRCSCFAGSADR